MPVVRTDGRSLARVRSRDYQIFKDGWVTTFLAKSSRKATKQLPLLGIKPRAFEILMDQR